MKRTINYYEVIDNGITITHDYTKQIITNNNEDFMQYLVRFYMDRDSDKILSIEERGKKYNLADYLNFVMPKSLYNKMMKKYFGKVG